ncbi:MAG: type II toxin-antitoxin system VapC family toxin [Acidobacteria bacterium]|nr:type II toxin-antitoxin system VapC family toxin [Acidobacteriota bacterium]
MRLLLDTHVFLWWCADDRRLGETEREAIRDGANDVFLSTASVWEMAIKQSLGRLQVPEPASAAVARLGVGRLSVTFEHAEATVRLPPVHRDPFDRLLVAQAKMEGLTLVTTDPLVRAYPGVAFLPA